MATYLVTGCAGFIGSHLTEALLARGDRVLGVDAFTDSHDGAREQKRRNLEGVLGTPAFDLVEGDLCDVDLTVLADRSDAIFHVAAQPGVRASWGETFSFYTRDNLVATQRVFEAAQAHRLRVVWASSSAVYGNADTYPTSEAVRPRPISPYGVTKLACEQLAAAYGDSLGLDAVTLRYFTVYGPRQRPDMAIAQIAASLAEDTEFVVYGTGEQTRDLTFVQDAVSATLAALERGASGASYNVGGGSETSLNEVIGLCEELSGRQLRVVRSPEAAGDARRTAADTTAALIDLGWVPTTCLGDGLEAQLEVSRAAMKAGD